MTREEEIREAVKKTTRLFSYRNGYSTSEDAFIAGAEWADANQSNPWISVEERLPERVSDNIPYSKLVFVRYIERIADQEYVRYSLDEMLCIGKIRKWRKHESETESVTHWMPIPELPKEE